jgi:hypothetical protein
MRKKPNRTRIPPEVRFWAKVNKNGPVHPVLGTACWVWTASVHSANGYGLFGRVGATTESAHRASWFFAHGDTHIGLCVLHRCDRKLCVRPDHLFLGTHADNSSDMVKKDRGAHGERHGQAKLTCDIVRQLRSGQMTALEAMDATGVSEWAIKNALTFKSWRHVQ